MATDLPTASRSTGSASWGDTGDQIRRAADGEWVEKIGTAGFVAKGVLYVIIGLTAASIAFTGGEASQQGAIQRIGQLPFGTVLLILLALGLGGYALLRLVHVLTDPSGEDGAKSAAMRASYLVRAVVYGGLCATTVAAIGGGGSSSGDSQPQQLTQRALELPAGTLLVGAAALVAIVIGLHQIYKGVTRDFTDNITRASGRTRTGLVAAGVVGHVARGIVFSSVGVLLAQAAMQSDSSEAGGLDKAIGQIAGTTYGTVLLPLVGLGLVGYGLFSIGMARYGTTRRAE